MEVNSSIIAKKKHDLKIRKMPKDAISLTFIFSEFFMPGLVDTHIHAPQYYFAGSHMDLQLLDWLTKYTYPTELKFKSMDFAEEVYTRVVVSTLFVRLGVLCLVTCRNTHFLGQILSVKHRQLRLEWTLEIFSVFHSPVHL